MTQKQHQQESPHKEIDWSRLISAAGPYPVEAFDFVREGLGFAADQVHANREAEGVVDRHISGQQLCVGLRDFAIHLYGLMAPTVMEHWNIRRTEDFGRIVFAMIEQGLMSKTPDDTFDDFRAVFAFDEAFSRDEVRARIARD